MLEQHTLNMKAQTSSEGKSPKESNSSKDVTPQTNNVQNEVQLQWEVSGLDPNKSFDWNNAELHTNNDQTNINQQDITVKDVQQIMIAAEEGRKPNLQAFDREALLAVTKFFGKQKGNPSKFDIRVVQQIESLSGMKINKNVQEQLEYAGMTEPYKMINKFGGNMKSFATFICYNKPSLFLEYEVEYVKKLYAMSRLLLSSSFATTEFKTNTWMKIKKKKAYNQTFLDLPENTTENIKYLWESDDFDLDIAQYFTQLKAMVSDIAFRNIRDVDASEWSVKSKGTLPSQKQPDNLSFREKDQKEEDGSTIQTHKSIPHNINVINEKFVTERKYRTSDFPQDTIDEYTNSIRKAVTTHSNKRDTNRRLSGFSKAISPNEPAFHPTMNEHVQGIPQMKTNTQLMLKAAAQQHETQNILDAPVEPQLHKVQFISPMKPHTPVYHPSISKHSSETENPHNPYDQQTEIYHQMQIIPPPTQQRKLFQRQALPESLIWKLDKDFEK